MKIKILSIIIICVCLLKCAKPCAPYDSLRSHVEVRQIQIKDLGTHACQRGEGHVSGEGILTKASAASLDYGKYKSKVDVYVDSNGERGSTMIVKQSDDNVLYDIKIYQLTSDKSILNFQLKQDMYYDFYLWDAIDVMRPLCNPIRLTKSLPDKTYTTGSSDDYTPLY